MTQIDFSRKNYKILTGDCIEMMRTLPIKSVQCCVTSPPYFGLRDYGVDGQIGLEPSPNEFVEALVNVFREVRRVLRDDGTLWLNLGDSYAGGGGGNYTKGNRNNSGQNVTNVRNRGSWLEAAGVKAKDLLGIPWRVAFALQADGWYLRQEIIWHKPNAMPESVKDRCVRDHEHIFLLSKSSKYYFDHLAIQSPSIDGSLRNRRGVWSVNTSSFKGAHFATFPQELIRPCVLAGTRRGDVVLDPFGGSGTTAMVAMHESRRSVLCELNPEYSEMAEHRITQEFSQAIMNLDDIKNE